MYMPATEGRGSLLRVVEFYDGEPTPTEQMMAGADSSAPRVMCCILSFFDSERRRCGGDIYDLRGGATKGLPFDVANLWHVDGLVSRVPPGLVAMGVKSLRGGTAEQMERRGAGLAYERYRFDWQRAQAGVDDGTVRMGERFPDWTDVPRPSLATRAVGHPAPDGVCDSPAFTPPSSPGSGVVEDVVALHPRVQSSDHVRWVDPNIVDPEEIAEPRPHGGSSSGVGAPGAGPSSEVSGGASS